MEHIVVTVLPVGERSVIRASLLNGLGRFNQLLVLRFGFFALFSPVLVLVRRFEVHSVRIDDFALFLKVEGLLVALNSRACKFPIVVLPVIREERLRVGVAHETIHAPSRTATLVTRRQVFEGRLLPDGLSRRALLEAVFTVVLSKATLALALGCEVELGGRMRKLLVITALSRLDQLLLHGNGSLALLAHP